MKLSEAVKKQIIDEFNEWEHTQYAGKTLKERQALGAFFTPPEITIRMLEKFDDLNDTLVDPTIGAGGLIAAAIIAGADPAKCYGIELDPAIREIAVKRLSKLGVPEENIIEGSCLDQRCWDKIEHTKFRFGRMKF